MHCPEPSHLHYLTHTLASIAGYLSGFLHHFLIQRRNKKDED